jgi:uncharacterized phage-associated protein
MALKFDFNEKKAIAALLYVSSRLEKADIHKIFKVLYFADQIHLAKFGRPIVGDSYVAMLNGPVPTRIYDYCKVVRGDRNHKEKEYLKDYFDLKQYIIIPKAKADITQLSESDVECLNKSIEQNGKLSFPALREKSHDAAYNAAQKKYFNEVSFEDMAKIAGANDEMLKYIRLKAQ